MLANGKIIEFEMKPDPPKIPSVVVLENGVFIRSDIGSCIVPEFTQNVNAVFLRPQSMPILDGNTILDRSRKMTKRLKQ